MSGVINSWLDPAARLTVRRVVSTLRHRMATRDPGVAWQDVFDALRPVIPQLWSRLDLAERSRFLRHARTFWEVHRHRMAPAVAETLDNLRESKALQVIAGTLVSAAADQEGIDVTFAHRGTSTPKTVRVSWVVNCTGPGGYTHRMRHTRSFGLFSRQARFRATNSSWVSSRTGSVALSRQVAVLTATC